MKQNKNKLIFIVWIGMIALLIFFIVNKPKPEEKAKEKAEIYKQVPEEILNPMEKETGEDAIRQEIEKTQERYFKEMADWANIGEGEE
ncbi:MAG: hypothetical protein Q4A29_07765 [Eubacteriales bacterium]|nr:hypothetical protein [Eubacteriales bacterium]